MEKDFHLSLSLGLVILNRKQIESFSNYHVKKTSRHRPKHQEKRRSVGKQKKNTHTHTHRLRPSLRKHIWKNVLKNRTIYSNFCQLNDRDTKHPSLLDGAAQVSPASGFSPPESLVPTRRPKASPRPPGFFFTTETPTTVTPTVDGRNPKQLPGMLKTL